MSMIIPNFLPSPDNTNVLKCIDAMGISKRPFYINVKPEPYCTISNCFDNAKEKTQRDGGKVVLGWQFAEYDYMIEAEFHAVWLSDTGELIDVTPANRENDKTLFVIDTNRSYNGKQIDNFRFNTTGSPIVDDILKLDKVRFSFLNSSYRISYNPEDLPLHDLLILNEISYWNDSLVNFFRSGGTLDTPCCTSNRPYSTCHRAMLIQHIEKVNHLSGYF